MNIKLMPTRHPHEDLFEEYVFERLSEAKLEAFEEHLLICEQCQLKLTRVEEYIHAMKAATAVYADNFAIPRPEPARFPAAGLRWNLAAAAVLLFTCLTGLVSWRTPVAEPQIVELQAFRSGTASFLAQAPSGRPLDLRIDLNDLHPADAYRVEIVDSSGRRVWFGGTPARVTKGLLSGNYWVRLGTASGEPLREFGLHVE